MPMEASTHLLPKHRWTTVNPSFRSEISYVVQQRHIPHAGLADPTLWIGIAETISLKHERPSVHIRSDALSLVHASDVRSSLLSSLPIFNIPSGNVWTRDYDSTELAIDDLLSGVPTFLCELTSISDALSAKRLPAPAQKIRLYTNSTIPAVNGDQERSDQLAQIRRQEKEMRLKYKLDEMKWLDFGIEMWVEAPECPVCGC